MRDLLSAAWPIAWWLVVTGAGGFALGWYLGLREGKRRWWYECRPITAAERQEILARSPED